MKKKIGPPNSAKALQESMRTFIHFHLKCGNSWYAMASEDDKIDMENTLEAAWQDGMHKGKMAGAEAALLKVPEIKRAVNHVKRVLRAAALKRKAQK